MTEGTERPEQRDTEPTQPGHADGSDPTPIPARKSDHVVQTRRKAKRDRDTYLHSRW